MKKIVGIGACVLDTLIETSKYPTEDTKLKAERVLKRGGGPVGNALAAVAVLGGDATYLGILPTSSEGQFLVDEYAHFGVKCDVARVEADAFVSFILLSADSGTRTCVFERGSIPDDPALLNATAIKQADILHLDGNFLNSALYAAEIAKSNGVKISLDAGGLYPNIEKLLPFVDILIPSAEFALGITQEKDIPSAMRTLEKRYHPEILAVTNGAEGGYYLDTDGEIKQYPSFKVSVKDSNGAGDVFHGAFLEAYAEGMNILECCTFASATSAVKCTGVGVKQSIPTKSRVLEFLKK